MFGFIIGTACLIGLKREWRINDSANSNPTILGDPYMLGVVEAFLIPEQ